MGLPMTTTSTDTTNNGVIMTPEGVAEFLNKSVSWVYKHWQELGGAKLGGSIFFPRKEDLYERIFNQKRDVAVQLQLQGPSIHRIRLQDQEGRQKSGGKVKGRAGEPTTGRGEANRHGLLGVG